MVDLIEERMGKLVDNLLAHGYFRMRQCMFTCNMIGDGDPVVWLRIKLQEFQPGKAFKRMHKLNQQFKVKVAPFNITREHKELYTLYKGAKQFAQSEELDEVMTNDEGQNPFNSLMVDVYDGNKLIASGFMDTGARDAAGIKSIYHPQYYRHSLGKYLIYLKMLYCKEQNKRFFYPGYVAKHNRVFDYKLQIGAGAIEYFDFNLQHWFSYTQEAELFAQHETLPEIFDAVPMFEVKQLLLQRLNSANTICI